MNAAKPRKRNPARREQVLEVATRLFGERGFNGVTVQAIAEECEISNAGLLYYFPSKDELLLAVLDAYEIHEREGSIPYVKAAERVDADADASWSALLALLRRFIEAFVQQPDVARLVLMMQVEALDKRHLAHEWFLTREQLTLELVTRLLERHVPSPESTAGLAVAMIHGLALHWLRQDMSFDLIGEWDKAADTLLTRNRLTA